MQIAITVKPSLEEVSKAFSNLQVQSFLRDEIHKIAFRVERAAKQLTPVDTGRLRASIATSWLIHEIGAMVSTNVFYSVFVHEGTKYMRARPFMEKGAEFAKGYIEGDMKARIDQEFAKAFKKL